MQRNLILTLILFLSLPIFAQTDSVLLWPDGVPGLKENSGVTEAWYRGSDDMRRVRNITNPMVYPYIPEGANEKTPAVVICPGGAYAIVSIQSEGFNLAEWFQQRGIAAFVLKYRLPSDKAFEDKKIVPLQDVQKAFMYIRENADKYNVNVDSIGVMGFSAGGHLAATASTLYKNPLVDGATPEELRPAFSLLIYPVASFHKAFTHKGSRVNLIGTEPDDTLVTYYSNEEQIDSLTPPAFLVHAMDDGAVPYENSVMYHAALRKNGVDSKLVILQMGGHGFGYKPNSPMNYWLNDLESWLISHKIENQPKEDKKKE